MLNSPLSDLILRTAQHDRSAFKEFYERTSPRMMAIATRLLGRRDLAEEAVQDAYVSAWQASTRFDPAAGSALAWITTITRRRAIDRLRASPWMQREVPETVDTATATDGSAADQITLQTCLNRLPNETRISICLCYIYGLTHSELSVALAQPLGTIKSRLRRGLLDLKECLQQ